MGSIIIAPSTDILYESNELSTQCWHCVNFAHAREGAPAPHFSANRLVCKPFPVWGNFHQWIDLVVRSIMQGTDWLATQPLCVRTSTSFRGLSELYRCHNCLNTHRAPVIAHRGCRGYQMDPLTIRAHWCQLKGTPFKRVHIACNHSRSLRARVKNFQFNQQESARPLLLLRSVGGFPGEQRPHLGSSTLPAEPMSTEYTNNTLCFCAQFEQLDSQPKDLSFRQLGVSNPAFAHWIYY